MTCTSLSHTLPPIGIAICLLLLLGCASGKKAYRVAAMCERTEIGNYQICWETDPDIRGKVRISVLDRPESQSTSQVFEVEANSGSATCVTKDNFSPKFFQLDFLDPGIKYVVGPRRVLLDSLQSLWDIGGVTNTDGENTRWGVIYFSQNFEDFSPLDMQKINSMGLHSIIALCNEKEKPEVETRDATIHLPCNDSFHLDSLLQRLVSEPYTNEEMRLTVRQILLSYVDHNNEQIRQALFLASDPDMYPILFCSPYPLGGLSYLGMLILSTCGVSDQAIVELYTEPNHKIKKTGRWKNLVAQMNEEQQEAFTFLITAHDDLMLEVMELIRSRYGSISNYLTQELGFGPEDQARLRQNILSN